MTKKNGWLAAARRMVRVPFRAAEESVTMLSEADGTPQQAFAFFPKTKTPVPLLLAFHAWSLDSTQPHGVYTTYARKNGWAFLFPNLRGPNTTSDACGSDLVVQDVISWVKYAKTRRSIDVHRIYLTGESGGGHLAALLAGRLPNLWAGVSVWCGIMNLTDWYAETSERNLIYPRHLEAVCSGKPGSSERADSEYRGRSPISWLSDAKSVPLSLYHGIHDGHRGASVPVAQSIRAFNLLASEDKRLSEEQITSFLAGRVPIELALETVDDPLFAGHSVLFRRTSGNVTLTIFDGGHESIPRAGLEWLKDKRQSGDFV